MPTIKYFDIANVSHNLTSYPMLPEAEKDLFAWQYVCSRVFKVSKTLIPERFQYMDFVGENTQAIQDNLLEQYQNRKNIEKNVINISSFTSEDLISTVKEIQTVPQSFKKDYLLLDLLLTQKVLNEKGVQDLSTYGKNLMTFVENLQSTEFKEVEININLVNQIINTEQKLISDKEYEIHSTQTKIKRANEEITSLEATLPRIEKERERQKEDSQYIANSAYSPSTIASLKRNRERREKNMGLVDTLKLKVFKYLGQNVNHFYNDNLDKMEELLQKEMVSKAQKFEDINGKLNEQENTVKQTIEDKKRSIVELETILLANKSADQLTLASNILDDNYIRDVSRIMKENNNIFIHSINDVGGFHPDDNSPIIKDISFKDKVDQIRCFSPSLSCSSFQLDNGSTIKDFTAPMGIILNSGVVASAARGDHGTKPDRSGNRQFEKVTSQSISEDINTRSTHNSYDEFAINNSQVAGLYCNYDRILTLHDSDIKKNKHVLTVMEKLVNYQKENPEMPLFILKDGHVCEVTPNSNFKEALQEFKNLDVKGNKMTQFSNATTTELLNKCFIVSEAKNVQDIINSKPEIELEKKCELAEHLIKNYKEPFKDVLKQKIKSIKERIMDVRDTYSNNTGSSLKYN